MDAPTSTFDLLDRFRQGDEHAFTELFHRYRPRLAVLIHYRLSPALRLTTEVDDMLQEVFLIAARDLDRFEYRSPGSFWRWLARIVAHVVADTARFHARQKRQAAEMVRFRSESNPAGADPATSETPSRIFSQSERLRDLLRRLDALPENYRNVILLAKFEGLETAEIAERLSTTREAAALLLHRALKRFREENPPDGLP
jgi:RNA polymerase sigma-70 factor (ECF subfamily)